METMPKQEKADYMQIDRKSLETQSLLLAAPLYRKHVQIAARRVANGEEIETIVDGSIVETKRTTTEGQWLVTNPTGVQFVLDDTTFRARHTATNTDGIYNAVGYCKAIQNPYGAAIEIQASWNAPQYGDADCYIADTCDDSGTLTGEPYLIDGEEFKATYQEVKN